MPGEVVGRVALDELVVHGWDIARASDQPYEPDERSVTSALEFVEGVRASEGDGPQEGLFAAVVPVPEDAPALDRLLPPHRPRPELAAAGGVTTATMFG